MVLGVITYYAKGGARAVEHMIPLDEDIVDMTGDGGKGDLNMREFTLDDDGDNSNDDGIDAKKNIKIESFSVGEEPFVARSLAKTVSSLKSYPTEQNDTFDSDEEVNNTNDNNDSRNNAAASKIN